MKRILTIATGFALLGLCLISVLRTDVMLRQRHATELARAFGAAPRHALAIPPAARAMLLTILR